MNKIQKLIWVIDTINRHTKISLEQLKEKYLQSENVSGGNQLDRQTFYRWREEIANMFGIEIECERGGQNRYHIANPEALEKGNLTQWMLNTYSTINSLGDSLKIKHRILTEPIPSSEAHLNNLIEAMKEDRVVSFTYQKFWDTEGYTCTVRPYCVKLFLQRWYLLGYSEERKALRTYGLDRMSDFATLDKKFELPDDFDAESYFSTFYGIETRDDIKCETITFIAQSPHNHYLRSLPLHATQTEIFSGDDYSKFQVRLRPNYEFYWKLLSMGDFVEILSPDNVRKEMIGFIKRVANRYE